MTNQIENQQEKLPAKYIADNMALMARDPESCSVAFGFDWQQELCANALRLLEEYDGVLRGLCSYLAAGGYNSEGLIDPQTADNKIRDGIDHIVKVEKVRAALCQPAEEPKRMQGSSTLRGSKFGWPRQPAEEKKPHEWSTLRRGYFDVFNDDGTIYATVFNSLEALSYLENGWRVQEQKSGQPAEEGGKS